MSLLSPETANHDSMQEQCLDSFCALLSALWRGGRALSWLDPNCTRHKSHCFKAKEKSTKPALCEECLSTLRSDCGYLGLPLRAAILKDDLRLVEQLCEQGASINTSAYNMPTALHLASGLGYIALRCMSPFHVRRSCHHTWVSPRETWEAMDRLNECDTSAGSKDSDDDNDDEEIHATEAACFEIVKVLLKYEANVSKTDGLALMPLHWSAVAGSSSIAELLLQHGAPVDGSCDDESPLSRAAARGHDNVVRTLLRYGADVNCSGKTGRGSPLNKAATNGHVAVVRCLLENGACIKLAGQDDSSLVNQLADWGKVAIVELLLQHGASPNPFKGESFTPLLAACNEGNLANARVLIKYGADVNLRNFDGDETADEDGNIDESPLLAATLSGREMIVKLLLDHGATIVKESPNYGTAVHTAIRFGDEAILQQFMNHGVDLRAHESETGQRILTLAIESKDIGTLKLLLTAGASLFDSDDYDNGLWVAANGGYEEQFGVLLRQMIPGQMEGSVEEHALKLACAQGRIWMVRGILRRAVGYFVKEDFGDAWMSQGSRSKDDLFGSLLDSLARFGSLDEAMKGFVTEVLEPSEAP